MTTTIPNNTLLPVPVEQYGEISANELRHLLVQVEHALPTVDDIETLCAWETQADLLVTYLKRWEMDRPAMGVHRKIEARIGQLLMPGLKGRPGPEQAERRQREIELIPNPNLRRIFRVLARALDGEVELGEEEWQQPRMALFHVVRQRLGGPMYPAPDLLARKRSRRRRKALGTPKERATWLRNAAVNAAAAANLALDLAGDKDVRAELTFEQKEELRIAVGETRQALTALMRKVSN